MTGGPGEGEHRGEDNAIHPEQSSFDYRWLKDIWISPRFQVVFAKSWHGELAWLVWLEKLGLICAGQLLIVDLALQFHERVKQRFRARRTTGNVNIDRNITVDAFENVITLLEWSTRNRACTHGDHVLRISHLVIKAHD